MFIPRVFGGSLSCFNCSNFRPMSALMAVPHTCNALASRTLFFHSHRQHKSCLLSLCSVTLCFAHSSPRIMAEQEVKGLRLLALGKLSRSTCYPLCDAEYVVRSDGGGIRGLSTLYILKVLMISIQDQMKLPEKPRPCDVFDLIGGTSTGSTLR